MNISNIAGIALGIKLINGKIRPKFGIINVISAIFLVLLLLVFFCVFMYGVVTLNFEYIIMSSLVFVGVGYIILINPFFQKSSNYFIEFQNENSLEGFKLLYKGKLVDIKYKIDNEGKIAFADNNSKLSCISYADGTQMSNFEKYRVINYFSKWLNDNNLLSSEITTTFEKL